MKNILFFQAIIIPHIIFGQVPNFFKSDTTTQKEIVVSGTMKEVSRSSSPIVVDVYNAKFFKSNPSCSVFDALQNVNGVKPQLNCNICNTGDIHINGLEGPYTMILIDGMPIVSGLSTVYGLAGIPQSLIERVEIIKGPASTLYGSEAIGGIINIITKRIQNTSKLALDVFGTSWNEINFDLSAKIRETKKVRSYLGLNAFNFNNPTDNNGDNFTDVTLQKRISLFNKWDFIKSNKLPFSIAGRVVLEDRWGGEMDWNKSFRGGDSIYAENIITKRAELLTNYQFPTNEKIALKTSSSIHNQNSVYGKLFFLAKQFIGFGQISWEKEIKNHEILLGAAYRYTFYDDNTVVTSSSDLSNRPSHTSLPGLFVQDVIRIKTSNLLLLGLRYDVNSLHGQILSPRINYKCNSRDGHTIFRFGIGNGYRVANIFTEDHAALTGSREVIFLDDLKPEKSWNGQLNLQKSLQLNEKLAINTEITGFYTYFTNKIIADYLSDPNKIIYNNLNGYAISRGITLNLSSKTSSDLKFNFGSTFMNVFSVENNQKISQLFTEKLTCTWTIKYNLKSKGIVFDYTGNLYSPMKLPLLGPLDPRSEFSPWWSIQNIQISKTFNNESELYLGIKNLLNWTPGKNSPFLIARANDPFDKEVLFGTNGQALQTPNNPYALTFDPSYVYGPNQGIRFFCGFRYFIK